MEQINKDFNKFAEAVKNEYVVVNEKGEWKALTGFRRLISRIFMRENTRLTKITTIFAAQMDKLAQSKISIIPQNADAATLEKYNECLAASEKLSETLTARQQKTLKAKEFAIKYRMGSANGGLDKAAVPNPELFQKLQVKATKWKSEQTFFKDSDKALSEADLQKLSEFCRYEDYAQLVSNDASQPDNLFKWSIRDDNAVDVFVEFPSVQAKLANCALSKRVGVQGNKVFGLRTNDLGEKDVTMAFVKDNGEVVHTSLLDEKNEVEFNNNFKMTIKDVYKTFADKRKDIIGNLEMFEKGIHNWNSALGSRFNGEVGEKIDMNHPQWWEQIPTYKTLSIQEAQAKYGEHMDGKNWTACAKSAFEKNGFDFGGNHGFMEVIIPVNGEYRVYPFGKFVVDFPQGALAQILFLTKTVKAQYHMLDQNVYYGHRQSREFQIPLTPDQGDRLMKVLKRDINDEEGAHDKFSLRKFNCSEWVQSTFKQLFAEDEIVFPEIYTMKLKDTTPQNALTPLFKAILPLTRSELCHPYKLAENVDTGTQTRLEFNIPKKQRNPRISIAQPTQGGIKDRIEYFNGLGLVGAGVATA